MPKDSRVFSIVEALCFTSPRSASPPSELDSKERGGYSQITCFELGDKVPESSVLPSPETGSSLAAFAERAVAPPSLSK